MNIKNIGSICSGIEAASVAWKPLGVQFNWFSEIADFPSMVLADKYPDIDNLGDMNDIPNKIINKEIIFNTLFLMFLETILLISNIKTDPKP